MTGRYTSSPPITTCFYTTGPLRMSGNDAACTCACRLTTRTSRCRRGRRRAPRSVCLFLWLGDVSGSTVLQGCSSVWIASRPLPRICLDPDSVGIGAGCTVWSKETTRSRGRTQGRQPCGDCGSGGVLWPRGETERKQHIHDSYIM